MGGGTFDADIWANRSATARTKSVHENFSSKAGHVDMAPHGVMRESRDSDEHPDSTPIIIALDVTGSMGHIPQYMITTGLGILFNEILNRLPVKDPQILVMAIGDAACDRYPVQVGQFESDIRVHDWLSKMYLEAGGGGNGIESYELAYWFALKHTSCDAMIKRGKRGYIFTIGDECPAARLNPSQVTNVFGDSEAPPNLSFADLISEVRTAWIPYHITCADSGTAQYLMAHNDLKAKWADTMGENALYLEDHTALSELVVSLLQINAGADVSTVASSWSGSKAVAVQQATKGLTTPNAADQRRALVTF